MERIAKFHKVSYEQFEGDWKDTFGPIETEEIKRIYEGIRLPARATAGSAGYDFYTPVAVTIRPGEIVKIPTGIRAEMNEGWVLAVFPRSSLGFKYRLQLNNTVGIIDSDYFFSDNEGHIFIKLTNDTKEDKTVELSEGAGFAQEFSSHLELQKMMTAANRETAVLAVQTVKEVSNMGNRPVNRSRRSAGRGRYSSGRSRSSTLRRRRRNRRLKNVLIGLCCIL